MYLQVRPAYVVSGPMGNGVGVGLVQTRYNTEFQFPNFKTLDETLERFNAQLPGNPIPG